MWHFDSDKRIAFVVDKIAPDPTTKLIFLMIPSCGYIGRVWEMLEEKERAVSIEEMAKLFIAESIKFYSQDIGNTLQGKQVLEKLSGVTDDDIIACFTNIVHKYGDYDAGLLTSQIIEHFSLINSAIVLFGAALQRTINDPVVLTGYERIISIATVLFLHEYDALQNGSLIDGFITIHAN